MAETYQAFWADTNAEGKTETSLSTLTDDDLPAGDVTVDVHYSTVNYKDGLAVRGNRSKIMRNLPMAPGIDYAGIVRASETDLYNVGDAVVLTGWGVGERHSGGFSQRTRAKSAWLVPKPDGLSLKQCMAIGTAGFTAMLAVMALEENGVTPDQGPILVTGAAGGVGSVAIALLSHAGYEVAALTGRSSLEDYLKGLGASRLVAREEMSEAGRPLASENWAGAIDTVGSQILANVLASTKYGGTVAACGLAAGFDLPTTVMPFILRGVKLAGIESVYCPKPRRLAAWSRLAEQMPLALLDSLTDTQPFAAVPDVAEKILKGQIRGRTVIDVNG